MKTVRITEPEAMLLSLLNQARHEDILVQLADGHVFMLTAIESFDEESISMRKNTALMSLLDARAKEPATIDLVTLKAEFGIDER